ncbi:SOS response-associated peptidase family protein [Brucella anthropi]|nr:SOS response-associated peptidase family protein [Brucella anthropi]
MMSATVFDSEASLDERRGIIRRVGHDVEMVELRWGLKPRENGGRPFTVVRAEGRAFPDHRCPVPASEFRHRSHGKNYSFRLQSGDFFYFAGIWCPATQGWPESYATLTTAANEDVEAYHDRQMAVLRRDQRMAWLDMTVPEDQLLVLQPRGSFHVSRLRDFHAQAAFAF